MTITLPLEPQKEAKRIGLARQRGLSADELVREAIDKILTAAPDQTIKPKKSAYWLLAQHGPGPTDEEIDENRREMFRGFGNHARYTRAVLDRVGNFLPRTASLVLPP
jgi:hypothetical protein